MGHDDDDDDDDEQRDTSPASIPAPAPTLGYRSGTDDRHERPRIPIPLQACLGFVIAAAIMLGMGLLGVVTGSKGGFSFVVIAAALLAWLGASLRGSEKHWGWTLGLWIGAGMTGLLVGYCYAHRVARGGE